MLRSRKDADSRQRPDENQDRSETLLSESHAFPSFDLPAIGSLGFAERECIGTKERAERERDETGRQERPIARATLFIGPTAAAE
jgi:hypothetical protein